MRHLDVFLYNKFLHYFLLTFFTTMITFKTLKLGMFSNYVLTQSDKKETKDSLQTKQRFGISCEFFNFL